jgi:hypothetical protein
MLRWIAPALIAVATGAAPALADSNGGASPHDLGTPAPVADAATLDHGVATAPAGAPETVQVAIHAANHIRHKPYVWGGGHGSWRSRGYDCSGAVSYVLHAAGLLDTPEDSGTLAHWGSKGKGGWITVYANGGHAYMVIAGLRFDTSGPGQSGPRWRGRQRSAHGYHVRHAAGL